MIPCLQEIVIDIPGGSQGHRSARSLVEGSDIFPTPQYLGGGDGRSVAIADIDGDGLDDILFGDAGDVKLFPGNSAGEFEDSAPQNLLPHGVKAVTGDFNNDSHEDIFVIKTATSCWLYLNNGTGQFPVGRQVNVISQAIGAHVVDINDDGNLDIVVSIKEWWTGSQVLLGDGEGNFSEPRVLPDENYWGYMGIASGDFDDDGDIDIIITAEAWREYDPETGELSPRKVDGVGTNLFLNDGNDPPSFTMQNIQHESGSDFGFDVAAGDVGK